MNEDRSLLFLGMYWLLVIGTLAISYFLLREVWEIREQKLLQVRVVERTVQVDVRMVAAKKRSGVSYPFLFAAAQLRVERLDTHAVVDYTEEKRLDKTDELVTHEFLYNWEPGKTLPAVERGGVLKLNPEDPWRFVLALFTVGWMMGTIAWMVEPFINGNDRDPMGMKLLTLGALPFALILFGIGAGIAEEREQKAVKRVAVEGRRKEVSLGDFLAEIPGIGVRAGDDVKKHFGESARTVGYCEFAWAGKTWRAASFWCQGPEGVTVAGRLNPADPRDVKWGQ